MFERTNRNSKNTLAKKLGEMGTTIKEAHEWLNKKTGRPAIEDEKQMYFDFFKTTCNTASKNCKEPRDCNAEEDPMEIWLRETAQRLAKDSTNSEPREVKNISQPGVVSFVIGATAEDTAVYVNGSPLEGVARAVLEYDADKGIPMLHLEILNPKVSLGKV